MVKAMARSFRATEAYKCSLEYNGVQALHMNGKSKQALC